MITRGSRAEPEFTLGSSRFGVLSIVGKVNVSQFGIPTILYVCNVLSDY